MNSYPLIVGTKFFEHDSALCYLDLNEKKIFALSTERVTRIKHDNFTVEPILKAYKDLFNKKKMDK